MVNPSSTDRDRSNSLKNLKFAGPYYYLYYSGRQVPLYLFAGTYAPLAQRRGNRTLVLYKRTVFDWPIPASQLLPFGEVQTLIPMDPKFLDP